MDKAAFTECLKTECRSLGFELVGVCPAEAAPRIDRFRHWLAAGYAGEMDYLADRAAAYEHPRFVLDGARGIVMLGMHYATNEPQPVSPGAGRVARYAWGEADYHDVIHARLKELCRFIRERAPGAAVRGVVDTAPILERDFAQLAGLGWVGKNTLVLSKSAGSYFFLAALLTDLELAYDQPFETDHCGTCRACLDACPTNAFPQPYVLDATKCISYLTIELRGPIPAELRKGVGDWLFGCDVCQDVCPWNSKAPASSEPGFQPREEMNPVDLIELFELDDASFRRRFRHTPLWRARRCGILRNAAIILGNRPSAHALQALGRGLNDDEPLVRGACAWSLGEHLHSHLFHPASRDALAARLEIETDNDVRSEIESALSRYAPAD